MTESKSSAATPAKNLLSLDLKKEATFRKKVQELKKGRRKNESLTPGVVYVGHLPREIFEPQLRSYLEQFGKVLQLRLSRSKKTGGSRGYAFVEFECDEVAKIVAETMNNYLIGEKLIKCKLMPPEKVHPRLFVGSNRKFRKPSLPAVKRYNRERSPTAIKRMTSRLLRKESSLRKRLAEKGIDYDFPGFAAQVQKKMKPSEEGDVSVCSLDDTLVCTPSVLEKRKNMKMEDEDDDNDEIIIKGMPTPKSKGKKKTPTKSTQEMNNENTHDSKSNDKEISKPSTVPVSKVQTRKRSNTKRK
ncbi:MKI67 FHA domain-interacting nucleolar phosphoprotein [Arapaima gigas]